MKKVILPALIIAFTFTAHAQDEILGGWTPNEGETIIKIYKSESGVYAGKVVWLKEATNKQGEPFKDVKNPNKELRDRTIMGMDMLENLKYDEGNWVGTLYTPKKGRTVDAALSLNEADNLDVNVSFRGFSKTITWTRSDLPK